jgi:copper chaperone CopZ
VGSCQTIIKNQIKTIDDNTITIEKISLAGTTATATVQSTVNGKKVDSSMTLAKQSGGWRIATISAL